MPLNKEPRTQKKKRQPSFTLPKNPYRHHYGTNPQPTKTKGPMVGTWTLLRSSTKQGQGRQDHQGLTRANKGFVTLNDKVSQNLDVQEIGSWMRKQKELYARHKRPPAVPKRSPETKLSSSDIQALELAEIDGALPPPDYDDDEQAPESGYITPEQQGSEVEYPLLSQARIAHESPAGSVSSGHASQYDNNPYTTRIEAEVHASDSGAVSTHVSAHVNAFLNNRGSVASVGSVPALPPPPPPDGAMALQMNPIHRASGKVLSVASVSTLVSSGSSSGTLHDPYQPDDIYEHFIPPTEGSHDATTRDQQFYGATLSRDGTYGGGTYNQEEDLYERTLPMPSNQNVPNVDGFSNRPLPVPPGDSVAHSHTMNYPGRNSMPNMGAMTMPNVNRFSSGPSPHSAAFPPPPPQFADNQRTQASQFHTSSHQNNNLPVNVSPAHRNTDQESGVDTSPTINSLPFPVKLRPIGSPLLRRANGQSPSNQDTGVYQDSILNTVVPPPTRKLKAAVAPPVKPKTGAADVPPPPVVSPASVVHPSSPHFPPPPPLAEPYYAEVSDIPPPPPMLPHTGMTVDLATRVQQWTISNDERSSRSGTHQPQPDPHSALINQIQTGIKLRKSVFGTRLFDSTCTREDTSQQNSTNFAANPSIDYTYVDSIETCSVISGDSSSSGCHSNSSFSNSTTSSLPPQTLPKPGSEVKKKITKDISQLPGYQPVPSNCPTWKSTMIEKKNNQVETDAKRQMLAQYEEEDRWKDIPEWKKTLIIEKEKRKQDDEAPLEAERRKREEEITRLQSLPEWKRDLIMKKRGDL